MGYILQARAYKHDKIHPVNKLKNNNTISTGVAIINSIDDHPLDANQDRGFQLSQFHFVESFCDFKSSRIRFNFSWMREKLVDKSGMNVQQ